MEIDENSIQTITTYGDTLTFGKQPVDINEVTVCFVTYYYNYFSPYFQRRKTSPTDATVCEKEDFDIFFNQFVQTYNDSFIYGDTVSVGFSRMIYKLE